jgi:hypothetical protein
LVIHLSAKDGQSGVASTAWHLDGGPAQVGTEVTVTGRGLHTLTFSSRDAAGNIEHARTVKVRITVGS